MGRISDGPHKKRLLLVSLLLILLGSVLAAVATNFALFLVGRALQGLTYGIFSVTISMARRYVEPATVQSSRSAERRVGQGCVCPCYYQLSPVTLNTK